VLRSLSRRCALVRLGFLSSGIVTCHAWVSQNTAMMPASIIIRFSKWIGISLLHARDMSPDFGRKPARLIRVRSSRTLTFRHLNSRFVKTGDDRSSRAFLTEAPWYDLTSPCCRQPFSFDMPSGEMNSFALNRLNTSSISVRSYPRLTRSLNAAETIATDAGSIDAKLGAVATADSSAKPMTSDSGRRFASSEQRQAAVLRRPEAFLESFRSSGGI
jgi:hypothetical protein